MNSTQMDNAISKSRAKVAAHVFNLNKLEMPDILSLAPEIRKKVLRQGARVIALEARRTAPDSGISHKQKLNKSIIYGVDRAGESAKVLVKAPHAHLVHDGAKAHQIPKADGDYLTKRLRMMKYFPGILPIHHPGIRKAQPFLVNAGESQRDEVERMMREKAVEVMNEVANK
jgi:HK97 gp10 family phage protein